ncbi:MAG TPA: tRNA pseudouridine(55) synthase TruB [Kofleriaceae bacterium]|nr:tRNA pseudouridine(55) synthase TruB [Kofleriaceae bacterium]
MHGVLVLDKPRDMSSASAVEHVRRRLGIKRAGHGGTLDPIATGVLAICLGEATKLAGYLLADDKEYEADLVLGSETDTYDRTGVVTSTRPADHITAEMIERVLAARTGEQDQLPPIYSAIKQDGVRMYHRARRGETLETIERTPRRIRIDRLALLDYTAPVARIAIACSKGTYVRSIVADIGTDLGVGAHMSELRRTRSGTFTLAQAHDLDRMDNCRIVPLEQATKLPIVIASDDHITKIRNGLQMPPDVLGVAPEIFQKFQLFNEARKLVAVAHVDRNRVIYDRVFAP